MAQLAVHRPFGKSNLHHDLGTRPVRAQPWQPDGSGEWGLRDLERIEPRAKRKEQLRVQTRTDLPRETKSSWSK